MLRELESQPKLHSKSWNPAFLLFLPTNKQTKKTVGKQKRVRINGKWFGYWILLYASPPSIPPFFAICALHLLTAPLKQ